MVLNPLKVQIDNFQDISTVQKDGQAFISTISATVFIEKD